MTPGAGRTGARSIHLLGSLIIRRSTVDVGRRLERWSPPLFLCCFSGRVRFTFALPVAGCSDRWAPRKRLPVGNARDVDLGNGARQRKATRPLSKTRSYRGGGRGNSATRLSSTFYTGDRSCEPRIQRITGKQSRRIAFRESTRVR